MTSAAFDDFRRLVWNEPLLQRELLEFAEESAFLARVVQCGKERGYNFSLNDATEALRNAKRSWIERNVLPEAPESINKRLCEQTAESLNNWLPIEWHLRYGKPCVEWCYFGNTRLSEPFFVDSAQRALRQPFNHLFRRSTTAKTLEVLQQAQTGLKPSGLIFHLSRCGSTLLAQMLSALPSAVVLSEPHPVDEVLRSQWKMPDVRDEDRVSWLRALTSAFSRPRLGEQHFFIKLDSWHIFQWRLIEAAFPDVPWIFLYRDPIEVLVSHHRRAGSQMIPNVIEPGVFGWHWSEVAALPQEEYGARVLARFCEAALEAVQNSERGLLINYSQLPGAVWTELPAHFGFSLSEADKEKLRAASQRDAKQPQAIFTADSAVKQREATPQLRVMAEHYLAEKYSQLEQWRLQQAARQSAKID